MALETGTFVDSLNPLNPTTADPKSQGDDHFRLIKSVIKNTFTAITGAITATHTELNFVKGVTSAIQAQIDSKGAILGQVWGGIHDFTSSVIKVNTSALGDNSSNAASTAFVFNGLANEKTRADLADAVVATNIGSMLGINFGSFSLVDGELIATHLTTSSPSLVSGDLILTYETL